MLKLKDFDNLFRPSTVRDCSYLPRLKLYTTSSRNNINFRIDRLRNQNKITTCITQSKYSHRGSPWLTWLKVALWLVCNAAPWLKLAIFSNNCASLWMLTVALHCCDRRFKQQTFGLYSVNVRYVVGELYSSVLTELYYIFKQKIHFIYFHSFFYFFDTKSKCIRENKLTQYMKPLLETCLTTTGQNIIF